MGIFLNLIMLNKLNNYPSRKVNLLSFEDTAIAFQHVNDRDLKRAYWIFKLINQPLLVKLGSPILTLAMKIGLPVQGIVKATLFKQFCGGVDIESCETTINNLWDGRVGSILDYSVEGAETEEVFDQTQQELMLNIKKAVGSKAIPFTVFKVTGLGRFALLEKYQANDPLNEAEKLEWIRVQERVEEICQLAFDLNVKVMIDSEESWIQQAIDELAINMMRKFNRSEAIVYHTYQLYRHDKLAGLEQDFKLAQQGNFYLGVKLVRGAYMEKERRRALEQGYASPIQPDKESTDGDYNAALHFCMKHNDRVGLVAGTHNEASCLLLTTLLNQSENAEDQHRTYFAQLLGMSDNLSFNLAHAGYQVAKYVPYGPVKAVMPYLIRRAEENTAIAGQMSRELSLINKEIHRRKL